MNNNSKSRVRPYGVQENMDAEIGASVTVLYSKMRKIENEGRNHRQDARYLPYRRLLVDWICECGEHYKLFNSTQHVAVGYMDKALQLMDVHDDRLQVVAMACLLIAAKYEEKEESCPSALQLVYYVANDFIKESGIRLPLNPQTGLPTPQVLEELSTRDRRIPSIALVHQMEVLLLNRLNWSLTIVSPLHYLGLYHRQGILYENDTLGYKPLRSAVSRFLVRYTDFFADFCLQEYTFNIYPPSLLAAAMVLAARRALNIVPIWNSALEDVLGYNETELIQVYETVWKYYAISFPSKVQEADELAAAALREAIENGVVPRPTNPTSPTTNNNYQTTVLLSNGNNNLISPSVSLSSSQHNNAVTPQSTLNMTIIATPNSAITPSSPYDNQIGYFSGGTVINNHHHNENYSSSSSSNTSSISNSNLDNSGVHQQLNFNSVFTNNTTITNSTNNNNSQHLTSQQQQYYNHKQQHHSKGNENNNTYTLGTKEQQQQQQQKNIIQNISTILSPMNQR